MADETTTTTAPGPQRGSLFDGLGPRALTRATPRLGTALGAAGAVLAALGTIVIGFDNLGVEDTFSGSADTTPGLLLMLLLLALGVAGLAWAGTGPVATGGAVMAMTSLPFLVFFATFDLTDFPPFSVDAALLVPTLVWGAAYFFGPARGRPLFLGGALVGAWLFVLEQVESVFSAPFALLGGGFFGGLAENPDADTMGVISLVFGAAYLLFAVRMDRDGRQGTATPAWFAAIVALGVGHALLGQDVNLALVGTLLTVTGVVVAYLGSESGRRGATWWGAVGVAFGLVTVIDEAVGDESGTTIGLVVAVVGMAVVFLAQGLAQARSEPGEFEGESGAGRMALRSAAPPAPAPPLPPPPSPPPPPPPA